MSRITTARPAEIVSKLPTQFPLSFDFALHGVLMKWRDRFDGLKMSFETPSAVAPYPPCRRHPLDFLSPPRERTKVRGNLWLRRSRTAKRGIDYFEEHGQPCPFLFHRFTNRPIASTINDSDFFDTNASVGSYPPSSYDLSRQM